MAALIAASALCADAPAALERWPFGRKAGGGETASLTLASFPEPWHFLTQGGAPVVVRAPLNPGASMGGFPHEGVSIAAEPWIVSVASAGQKWGKPPSAPASDILEPSGKPAGQFNEYLGNDPAQWKRAVPVYESYRTRPSNGEVEWTQTIQDNTMRLDATVRLGVDASLVAFTWDTKEPIVIDTQGVLRIGGFSVGSHSVTQRHGSSAVEGHWVRASGRTAYLAIAKYDLGAPVDISVRASRLASAAPKNPPSPVPPDGLAGEGIVIGDVLRNVYLVSRAADRLIVQKLDEDGLVHYTTFLGEIERDALVALAIDPKGNLLVAAAATFGKVPVTRPTDCKDACSGVVVARLGAHGELLDSSFLGGIANAAAMAIDPDGRLAVAGRPRAAGSAAARLLGEADGGYVLQFDAWAAPEKNVRASIAFGDVSPAAVTIDRDGAIVVGGVAGAQALAGAAGARPDPAAATSRPQPFLLTIDPARKTVVAQTYLGGHDDTGTQSITSITTDGAGNIYAAGKTAASDFPTTEGAWVRVARASGAPVAFLCKFDPKLAKLRWSTLLSGWPDETIAAIGADRNQNVCVYGDTSVRDFTTLRAPAWDHDAARAEDRFVFAAQVDSLGRNVAWSGLLARGRVLPGGRSLAVTESGATLLPVHPFPDDPVRLAGARIVEAPSTVLRIEPCQKCPRPPLIERISSLGNVAYIHGWGFTPETKVLLDGRAVPTLQSTPEFLQVGLDPAATGELEVTLVRDDLGSTGTLVRHAEAAPAPARGAPPWLALLQNPRNASIAGAAALALCGVLLFWIQTRRRKKSRRAKPIATRRGPPPAR